MIRFMEPPLLYLAVLALTAMALALVKYVEVTFIGIKYGSLRAIFKENEKFKNIFLRWVKRGNLMLASLQFLRYLLEIFFILFLFHITENIVFSLLIAFGVFLIFGEYVPRTLAVQQGVRKAYRLYGSFYYVAVFLSPFVRLLMLPADILIKVMGGEMVLNAPYMTDLEEQIIKNVLSEDNIQESEMISSILEFKETTVREIMVPRVDIVAVSSDVTFDELIDVIDEEGHSRLPVYDERLDNILGIVYVKDLIRVGRDNFSLSVMLRDVFFIPETKKINSLLKDFQAKHMHMAFVVDEYGDLVGLVTIEDVLEEIVGEIEDEYDEEESLYRKIADNEFIVSPKMTLEEFEDEFAIDLTEHEITGDEDFETLAGFIIAHLGNLPKRGFEYDYGRFILRVTDADNRRILKVYLKIKENDSPKGGK
ncbi:MAG TPA: HlyC/CorC family transporter [Firmicutes bacterium]|nr:HlyC/CorC family transporter [Bacillota bacterium]